MDAFIDRIKSMTQSSAEINLKSLKFIYNFAIIPSGGGVGTKCREIEAILGKNQLLKLLMMIINVFGTVWQSYLTLTIDH